MKYQINGKIEQEINQINGLKDIIGLKAKNVFACATESELEEKMSDMSLIDLQRLAVSCGISGGGTRSVLKTKIKTEFIKFLKGSLDGISSINSDALSGEDLDKRRDIIAELMS